MFSSDSEMSDFIDDEDEETDEEDSSMSDSAESDENLTRKAKKACQNAKKRGSAKFGKTKKSDSKKRTRRGVSSSEDSDCLDTPLSKLSKKRQNKQECGTSSDDEELPKPTKRLKKRIDESDNDSTSLSNTAESSFKQDKLDSEKSSEDEELISRTKRRKSVEAKRRNAVVESSNSEPESTQRSLSKNHFKLHKNESDDGKAVSSSVVRPRSRRLQKMTQKQADKHNKMFGSLIQKRQEAKLLPGDKKSSLNPEKSLIQDKQSTSGMQSNETNSESSDEVGNVLWENRSEMDEDESDRDFVVADEEDDDSDIGMNSDRESEFLQLLNQYARKHNPESEDDSITDTPCNSFGRNKRKKNRRKMHKWRRLMNRESENEESEEGEDQELNDSESSLHASVLRGDINGVKECLEQDPDCVYHVGSKKKTALHVAAARGNANIVKLLLESGADRTAQDSAHLTAVAYAADGHPECLVHLLAHTSIKHVSKSLKRNGHQMSLLHFAVGCLRDGLDCSARARCLELMFSHDKKAALKLLERRGHKSLTPLEAAVCAGQHEVALEV